MLTQGLCHIPLYPPLLGVAAQSQTMHTAVIVGGSVGGLFVLAVLLYIFTRRKPIRQVSVAGTHGQEDFASRKSILRLQHPQAQAMPSVTSARSDISVVEGIAHTADETKLDHLYSLPSSRPGRGLPPPVLPVSGPTPINTNDDYIVPVRLPQSPSISLQEDTG